MTTSSNSIPFILKSDSRSRTQLLSDNATFRYERWSDRHIRRVVGSSTSRRWWGHEKVARSDRHKASTSPWLWVMEVEGTRLPLSKVQTKREEQHNHGEIHNKPYSPPTITTTVVFGGVGLTVGSGLQLQSFNFLDVENFLPICSPISYSVFSVSSCMDT